MNLSKLKNHVISLIGYSNYRKLLTSVMRKITKVDSKIMCGGSVKDIEKFCMEGKDTFFGYYDLVSLSTDGKKLLSLVVNGETADIGYFDVATKIYHKVSETHAWNWQMGARMRWYESGKSILFNDYDGRDFISRVVNVNGNEIARFTYPIFDYDSNSGVAYFCDFTILHYLREGYGYPNKKVCFDDYYNSTENGLFRFYLGDNAKNLVMSIEEIKKLEPCEGMEGKYHYINHITINPENGDVMFFHLWTSGSGTWKNRMVFLDKDGTLIKIIHDFDRASHYDWKDKDSIIASVYINEKCEYRLYNYRLGTYELLDGISTDGHPTFVNSRFFITDTYANHCGMQSVYMCDSKDHTYRNMFSIYHSPNKTGPERCDLHPRIMGDLINIDSVAGSHRSQYLMTCVCEKRETSQWDRRLILDKQAYIENPGPKSDRLFSCMDSEYCFITGREKSNKIKVLKMFIDEPIFRANVYVAQMQATTSKSKKKRLRNKLESKYGMVVDQNSKIGIHFRADHAVGIVIGPGSVIGDYCKMYQNVTLGQKAGRFPTIGNHVVIYPGAKIIGGIKIGDYAVIGANAVVTKDVPDGAVAVGIPARNIIRE